LEFGVLKLDLHQRPHPTALPSQRAVVHRLRHRGDHIRETGVLGCRAWILKASGCRLRAKDLVFGVWGLEFGVWSLVFGVWGLGFGVGVGILGFGFWVLGLGYGVWVLGFGFRDWDFRFWGLGFRVWGLGFGATQGYTGIHWGMHTQGCSEAHRQNGFIVNSL